IHSAITAPLRSWRVPFATPSETVSTAIRIGRIARSTPDRAVLVERRPGHRRGARPVADHDLDRGARLGCASVDVGEADALAERRAVDAARDLAARLAVHADLVAVAGKAALAQDEAGQPFAHALLLLP